MTVLLIYFAHVFLWRFRNEAAQLRPLISPCPSVRFHGTTREPLDGF
jgi:hypothetical protein